MKVVKGKTLSKSSKYILDEDILQIISDKIKRTKKRKRKRKRKQREKQKTKKVK